jgi:hypothetical protein
MKDSKLLLITVLETCERLYLQGKILESILTAAHVPGWRELYEKRLNESEAKDFVHQTFQPLYDLANREVGADKALEELLRDLPKRQRWN